MEKDHLENSFTENPVQYLKPRNDIPDFDINKERRFQVQKMDFVISLVGENSANSLKIL